MSTKKHLIDNKKYDEVLYKEAKRREKILENYLTSNRVKQLKKDVRDVWDKVNMNIAAYNDIVMEDYYKHEKTDWSESNTYTSVDGELRLNYKEDPKSW